MIAKPHTIFGLDLVPKRMIFCWKFPLLDVDDDGRMLGIQGEML
jgi:hypothetical protein